MNKKQSGYYVETKNGKFGRTYHSDPLINGKQPVYVRNDSGTFDKILCDPDTLKLKGYID